MAVCPRSASALRSLVSSSRILPCPGTCPARSRPRAGGAGGRARASGTGGRAPAGRTGGRASLAATRPPCASACPVCIARRPSARRIGLPWGRSAAWARRTASPARSRRTFDDRLVGSLHGEEAPRRVVAGRVRVVLLRQAPIRSLDLVERGCGRQAERAVRVDGHARLERRPPALGTLPVRPRRPRRLALVSRSARRPVPARSLRPTRPRPVHAGPSRPVGGSG